MTDALLAWFDRRRRDLPWRRDRTPYRVWVAEVMLQQTRVATAVPYYHAWLEAFPDVASLAAAPLDAVLKRWEGLGYYRRARNLHRAAGVVVERFGGHLPGNARELRELPGVGAYTAAAVASIAFGEPVLAIDGNVRRVAARLFALDAPTDRLVEAGLGPLVPADRPGDFNEALMDLGAGVCLPRNPACGACPLRSSCRARALGAPERFPAPKARPAPSRRTRYALVAVRDGSVTLRRRPEEGMLGGLWGFPEAERPPEGARRLDAVVHAYSHFTLDLVPVLVSDDAGLDVAPPGGARRVPLAALDGLALAGVDRKVLARLREHGLLPEARGLPEP